MKSHIAEMVRGYATNEYSHATRSRDENRLDLTPWTDDDKFVTKTPPPIAASGKQVGGGHYQLFMIQPSEFIHQNRLGWCEGNAIKYVCRHKNKNGRQDIEKAIHYLELLLEWEYGDEPANRNRLHHRPLRCHEA